MARRAADANPPDETEVDFVPQDLGDLEAFVAADEGWTWNVHRLKSQDEIARNPRSKARVWVTRIHGIVDLPDFHQRHGGGVYEFWGSSAGQLQKRITIELEGPPKVPVLETPTPAAVLTPPTVPAATSPLDVAVLHQLERMSDRLDRMERAPVAPSAPQATMKDLAETMVLLDGLHRGRSGPADPNQEVVATMMEQWRQGYETGQMVGGGNESSQWVEAAKVIAPVFSRVMDRVAARRGGAPPAAGTPPGPSSAEVVDEGRPAPPPLDDLATARMMTAVDALARAFSRQLEAEAFADSLRDILTDTELGILVSVPPEAAVAMLVDRAGPHRELLSTEPAKAYTVAVLRSLNSPPETEPPPA